MTREDSFAGSRKGQSAIEYLMTYGWMLLVVAIVGGAIFATVQGQCAKQSSGFTGAAVTVDSFGATGDNLQVVFQNSGGETVNITSVEISNDQNNQVNDSVAVKNLEMNVGDTGKVVFDQLEQGEACNNFDLDVTLNKGEIEDQTASGGLSGQIVWK